ncbi:hypothetical protein DY000_02020137 [Brassica cretica]|uniref:Uncharacterized protein n=1 Tax=Brassica cretica TaxID=69181 RepID=A0ABQ7E9N2_BRACR|nr:hypothetical protein DY000_02020137 [Brassica cretica]
MDFCCWTCASLNKNSGWRWNEDNTWLAGQMSLSSRIGGWNGVRNRHKFGNENLIRFKDLLDGCGETFSYGIGSTSGSRTTPNFGNLYLDGLIRS